MAKDKQIKQTFAKDEAKPKQALKDQTNKKAKPFVDVDTSVKWRYACPMCTNVAFKAVYPNIDITGVVCASCGKVLPPTVRGNYIKL